MNLRIAAVTLTLSLVMGLATGCIPEPAASPSPTGFATEEEAFAAAEATYRAYVDALNARREDPASHPDPQSFLIGAALDDDLETQRQFAEAGVRIEGPSTVSLFSPLSASPGAGRASLDVCLDSSSTRVVNTTGDDVTPSDRKTLLTIQVDFVVVGSNLMVENSRTKRLDGC